jgi:hypothetical protein
MKIVKILVIVVVSLLVLFYAVGFFLPKHCHIERSVTIKTTEAELFNELNSFKNFDKWSPWAKKDTKAKYWYSGPAEGVGNRMDWKGDPNSVGSGFQKILESKPNSFINIQLVFDQMVNANANYKIENTSNGLVKLTWGFDEDMESTMDRYMGVMMESFLGADYEAGVQNLKKYIESKPKI